MLYSPIDRSFADSLIRCATIAAVLAAIIAPSGEHNQAQASELTVFVDPEVYIAASIGVEATGLQLGGNTAEVDFPGFGSFTNSDPLGGDDDFVAPVFGLAIGLGRIVTVGNVSLRAEAEIFGAKQEVVLGSFDFSGTDFFAATDDLLVGAQVQNQGVLLSLWADIQPFDDTPLILSLGGGVGVVQTELVGATFSDFGSTADTNFAFMLGGQAAWEIDDNWTLALTGRMIDYGVAEVATDSLFAQFNPGILVQTAPGKITVDQTAFQALLTLRLRFGLNEF